MKLDGGTWRQASRTAIDEIHAAVHEAGHATLGRVLGLPSGAATIVPNDGYDGHAMIGELMAIARHWGCNDRRRSMIRVISGTILAKAAPPRKSYSARRAVEITTIARKSRCWPTPPG